MSKNLNVKSTVPDVRIEACNEHAPRPQADFVLYWMIAARRPRWNFGLQRAVDWARELDKPLLVLEALRCDYRWASERLHSFVIEGMLDNAAALQRRAAFYYPYVEHRPGDGKGLLAALARRACVVVTDEFPCFFLPGMVRGAARRVPVRLEQVDANGLLPLRATRKVFPTAFALRRFLHQRLPEHLEVFPKADPLLRQALPVLRKLPAEIARRWAPLELEVLGTDRAALRRFIGTLPLDTDVQAIDRRGGFRSGVATLKEFIQRRLPRYGEERNQPEVDVTSGLSPYLHFGHVSTHQILRALAKREDWSPAKIDRDNAKGQRAGWWGMSEEAEGFLDELVTWRELGYNMSSKRDDYERYESLPYWARETLEQHENDPREHVYELEEFGQARTHDPLWNAAQRQLVREGRIHNYLRMLWGKKILEWSGTPRDALATMIELNNRYAVDGRNPNSYSGIFWVLGRYDRPWGPERPVFGKIRYMSSANTARKVRVKDYVARQLGQARLS